MGGIQVQPIGSGWHIGGPLLPSPLSLESTNELNKSIGGSPPLPSTNGCLPCFSKGTPWLDSLKVFPLDPSPFF